MAVKQEKMILYKNRGETPLECINRFKIDNPEYKNEKMTYAGRLDPLADGLLLIMIGEECKNKEKYLKLDKEYEVDVLFGFSTDTYDILGMIIDYKKYSKNQLPNKALLQSFVGKFLQKYPAYSSKFFNQARSGELNDNEIESKDVEIKKIEVLAEKTISKKDLEKYVKDSINLVKGDFRQAEILKTWEFVMTNFQSDFVFQAVSIKVNCTSGTYMRSLANSIGERVGIPALALNIKRTKIGKYKLYVTKKSFAEFGE